MSFAALFVWGRVHLGQRALWVVNVPVLVLPLSRHRLLFGLNRQACTVQVQGHMIVRDLTERQ